MWPGYSNDPEIGTRENRHQPGGPGPWGPTASVCTGGDRSPAVPTLCSSLNTIPQPFPLLESHPCAQPAVCCRPTYSSRPALHHLFGESFPDLPPPLPPLLCLSLSPSCHIICSTIPGLRDKWSYVARNDGQRGASAVTGSGPGAHPNLTHSTCLVAMCPVAFRQRWTLALHSSARQGLPLTLDWQGRQ